MCELSCISLLKFSLGSKCPPLGICPSWTAFNWRWIQYVGCSCIHLRNWLGNWLRNWPPHGNWLLEFRPQWFAVDCHGLCLFCADSVCGLSWISQVRNSLRQRNSPLKIGHRWTAMNWIYLERILYMDCSEWNSPWQIWRWMLLIWTAGNFIPWVDSRVSAPPGLLSISNPRADSVCGVLWIAWNPLADLRSPLC